MPGMRRKPAPDDKLNQDNKTVQYRERAASGSSQTCLMCVMFHASDNCDLVKGYDPADLHNQLHIMRRGHCMRFVHK